MGSGLRYMIPYETGLAVVILALASSVNGAFKNHRWFSFTCLSLAAFGITGLAIREPSYDAFFVFSPQILAFFSVAVFYCHSKQRTVLALIVCSLLASVIFAETWPEQYLDKIISQLFLFVCFMFVPAFIFRLSDAGAERAEKLISLQQFWLRISFLMWCRQNLVNLQHYDIFTTFFQLGSAILAVFFVLRIALNRSTWALSNKSLLSAIMLLGALSLGRQDLKVLLILATFVGLVDFLPGSRDYEPSRFLRRMNLGGFGGASFWGMFLFVLSSPMAPEFRLGWLLLILLSGFAALSLPMQNLESSDSVPAQQAVFLTFFGLLLQAAFFGLLLFWSEIKNIGV
jgi:hypothetical protein